jgi:hypothetical protein
MLMADSIALIARVNEIAYNIRNIMLDKVLNGHDKGLRIRTQAYALDRIADELEFKVLP